jgi:2-polyprenyl-6-methoxyphenol hydroxylase-like FAD-dependent oxidoreductase
VTVGLTPQVLVVGAGPTGLLLAAEMVQPSVILTPLPEQRWRVYLRRLSGTSDLVAEAGEVLEQYAPGVSFAAVENPRRFRCQSGADVESAHASRPGDGSPRGGRCFRARPVIPEVTGGGRR